MGQTAKVDTSQTGPMAESLEGSTADRPPDSSTRPNATPTREGLTVLPSVVDRQDLRLRLEQFRRTPDSSWWELAGDRFQRSAVETLWRGDGTSTFLVDVLLSGPLEDLAAGQWDPAYGELPTGHRPLLDRVHLVCQDRSARLLKAQGVRKAGEEGLVPTGRNIGSFWFKQVC